jgi:hypothetical protein
MKTQQRLLLALALVCLVVGIPVTFARVGVSPLWTLALPLGAVFLGLYLITLLAALFDAEQDPKTEPGGILTTAQSAGVAQPATPSLSTTPRAPAPLLAAAPPHTPPQASARS